MVLLYASKYHDVRTVINVSGRYDLKKGMVERFGEEFMEKLKEKGYVDVKYMSGKFANFFNTVLFEYSGFSVLSEHIVCRKCQLSCDLRNYDGSSKY